MLNRRRFIGGLVSLGVFGPILWGGSTARRGALQGPLSRDVFLALRQQTFTAVVDGRRVPLVLVAVSDDARDAATEQFTVRFQAPRDLLVTDGACTLSHPTAGTTRLYVQAAGADEGSSYVKAPFNLLS